MPNRQRRAPIPEHRTHKKEIGRKTERIKKGNWNDSTSALNYIVKFTDAAVTGYVSNPIVSLIIFILSHAPL